MNALPLVGRILLAIIFVVSGFGKFANWNAMLDMVRGQGMPLPAVALFVAAVIEVICGLMLLAGWKARWVSTILFLYLIPTTLVFHDFWAFHGTEMQAQMVNFLKNLAIMGGLAGVAAWGAGPYSVDAHEGSTARDLHRFGGATPMAT